MAEYSLFDELKERGIIAQCTDEEKVRELLDKGGATFYIGFDPTADSLHIGHFVSIVMMRRPDIAIIIYLPSSGIAAIQTAAMSILR